MTRYVLNLNGAIVMCDQRNGTSRTQLPANTRPYISGAVSKLRDDPPDELAAIF